MQKRFFTLLNFKLGFSTFRFGNMFSVKDPVPRALRAGVVYKICVRAVMPEKPETER